MTFSLRSKLFMLVGSAVILATLPVIFFSRSHIMESSVRQEREAFANAVTLVEDGLSVRYLHLLTSEVENVLQSKDYLRQTASLIAKALNSDEDVELLRVWRRSLAEQNYRLALFDANGTAVIDDMLISRATSEGVLDFKGQSVRHMAMLNAKKKQHDQFAVVRIADPVQGGEMPLLLFFTPVTDRWVLVLAEPVADTVTGRRMLEERMSEAVRDKLESIKTAGQASIAFLDGSGNLIAGLGSIPVKSLPEDVLTRVHRGDQVEGTTEDGSTLYRLAYFKALDWYILASIPMKSITGPAALLTNRLLLMAIVLLSVSLLPTLLLAVKILSPLLLLTDKAKKLAAADLSEGKECTAFAETVKDLPVDRNDEVGQLSLSFANMAQALAANIQKLVDTTAASQRMQGELNAAKDIQMGILPSPDCAPSAGKYAASAFLQPAKEVGGDLYDFFVAPDGRQAVIIGDVSDKGVPAALFMSMTVTLVRYALAEGLTCAEAMSRINENLAKNNPSCMFVTLFIGLFDPATGILDYASGAHCPPFVVSPDRGVPVRKLKETSGPLVGAMPGMEFTPCQTRINSGEYCLLYTDGVSECMNEEKSLFGEDRIAEVLDAIRGEEPVAVIQKIMESVESYRGEAPQSDDITMLCFKRL
ncbi:MAG: SpoIIE family protein phosphatase [Mailhella sp.]|nr:SpoIIE family protein phosphatase [Mailhella sp.]